MFDLHGFGGQMALGALMTVQLALGALAVGLVLGLMGAVAKLSRDRLARAVGRGYTTIVRGIPELLVVLVIYFGSSGILTTVAGWLGHDEFVELSPYVAGIIALGLTFGAYATEVFRGAILAVPIGQIEAARAYGMGPWLTFRRIVLPQVWRIALPGLANLFLVLLKDTSLISAIGLNELLRASYIGAQSSKDAFTFYTVAALIYLAMTVVAEWGRARLEKWSRRGIARARA
ncbi:MAG: ABC transporter permease [Rhodobacterales bacterium]|nr:ABC transporter permease [Rhodobacterales bacterium]